MIQTIKQSGKSDEITVSNISEKIEISPAEIVATEIERIIPTVKATVISTGTLAVVQIDNNGILSAVRVREARKGSSCDYKITHSGGWEDQGAKAIGDVGNNRASIKANALKAIVSQSTKWDIDTISDAIANTKYSKYKYANGHPSIGIVYGYNADGKVGLTVNLEAPNAKQWQEMKQYNKTNHTIPSGKVVLKIIAESDVDYEISGLGISINGTVEQVNQVIDRITGNPLTDW